MKTGIDMRCCKDLLALLRISSVALLVALMALMLNVELSAQEPKTKLKPKAKQTEKKNKQAGSKKPGAKSKQGTKQGKKKVRPEFASVEDVAGLPRVLLLGDSISIGYTLQVREGLKGKANVHRPPFNCGPTTRGLQSIGQWLGDKKWDVIHLNWGLHDLKYMGPNNENLADPADEKNHQQVPPAEYEKNLGKLVERLKKTNAKLIWRNTTPVPEGAKGRVVGDSAKYNAIAAKVMNQHGVAIHDMFSFVQPKMAELMQPKGNVHFKKAGSQVLADDVVEVILGAFEADKEPETK